MNLQSTHSPHLISMPTHVLISTPHLPSPFFLCLSSKRYQWNLLGQEPVIIISKYSSFASEVEVLASEYAVFVSDQILWFPVPHPTPPLVFIGLPAPPAILLQKLLETALMQNKSNNFTVQLPKNNSRWHQRTEHI